MRPHEDSLPSIPYRCHWAPLSELSWYSHIHLSHQSWVFRELLPITFLTSNNVEKMKSESEVAQSCLTLTPWTVAYQASPSMGFSRQEYQSGLPFPSPGDLPNPGIKPRCPALQADALPSEPVIFHLLGVKYLCWQPVYYLRKNIFDSILFLCEHIITVGVLLSPQAVFL